MKNQTKIDFIFNAPQSYKTKCNLNGTKRKTNSINPNTASLLKKRKQYLMTRFNYQNLTIALAILKNVGLQGVI
jgi:hypothetical protein